jgi:hypothetical protein
MMLLYLIDEIEEMMRPPNRDNIGEHHLFTEATRGKS